MLLRDENTDFSDVSDGTFLPLIHPGELLKAEFLDPMGISQNALAQALGIAASQVNRLVTGHHGISAEMALRLGLFFETSPDFWLNLQKNYEMSLAKRAMADKLASVVTPYKKLQQQKASLKSENKQPSETKSRRLKTA
jgi:addiction module HigA family antidote